MRFSNNKLTRDELLSRFFPHYHPVASLSQTGLSGGSVIISDGDQRRVLRQPHDPSAAACYFRRQYRALRRLPARLAPNPLFYSPCWMVVEYCAGEVKSELPDCPQLSGLLYDLHQQPRFGWRVSLGPLLAQYWQRSDPARTSAASWWRHMPDGRLSTRSSYGGRWRAGVRGYCCSWRAGMKCAGGRAGIGNLSCWQMKHGVS